MQLVVATRSTQDETGDVIDGAVWGQLSIAQRSRVGRPYTYLDEEVIYDTEILIRSDDDKVVEKRYRVWARENDNPRVPHPTVGPVIVNNNVADRYASSQPDEVLRLDVELRDYPTWDVPLRPDALTLSPSDLEHAEEVRAEAIDQRRELFSDMSAELSDFVEVRGGTVLKEWWRVGWLTVELPASEFSALASRSDIFRIDGPYGKEEGPDAGPKTLEAVRNAKHLDANQFIDNGYDGEHPNPARHSYGDITVAITESGGFEGGACAFRDLAGCTSTSRVRSTSRCDNTASNPCQAGTLDLNSGNEGHGTWVASIVLGDYRDGQANGAAVGDPSWTNNNCTSPSQCASGICESQKCAHTSVWEENRSGMAPEASALLFGIRDPANPFGAFADMIDDAIDLNADILNGSWRAGDSDCDMIADSVIDQEVEHAFDDQMLVVFSAGNNNGDNASSCTIMDPKDTPKAFVVNAWDQNTTNCQNNPSTRCLLDRNSCSGGTSGCSARGGADADVAVVGTRQDAVSLVDLVAPNDITGVTTSTSGSQGNGGGANAFVGTSAAAPHVAGLAAVVKDWLVDENQSWINDTGYLHTMMLAMGDRHRSSNPASGTVWTSQDILTADKWYGMGRAKLRLLETGYGYAPYALSVTQYTRTSSGGVGYYPFGTAGLPSGVNLVKCVSHQIEDMSGSNTEVSEFHLEVRLRNNGCGGSVRASRISDGYDLKKLAAIEGQSSKFQGHCVEVELQWDKVTAKGLTVQTACYYAGIDDDEW